MTSYEEVPDYSWMIVRMNTDEVLYHSSTLDEILTHSKEYEDDEIYITKKHHGVINL